MVLMRNDIMTFFRLFFKFDVGYYNVICEINNEFAALLCGLQRSLCSEANFLFMGAL